MNPWVVLCLTVAAVLALVAIYLYLVRAEQRRRLEPLDTSYKRLTSQLRSTRRVR